MPVTYTLVTMSFHIVLAYGLNALAVRFGLTKGTEGFTMYFVALSMRYLYSINKFLDNINLTEKLKNLKETTKTEEKQ